MRLSNRLEAQGEQQHDLLRQPAVATHSGAALRHIQDLAGLARLHALHVTTQGLEESSHCGLRSEVRVYLLG